VVGRVRLRCICIVHLLAARPLLSSPQLALNAIPLTPGAGENAPVALPGSSAQRLGCGVRVHNCTVPLMHVRLAPPTHTNCWGTLRDRDQHPRA
jgi:hypothetical protein